MLVGAFREAKILFGYHVYNFVCRQKIMAINIDAAFSMPNNYLSNIKSADNVLGGRLIFRFECAICGYKKPHRPA